MADRGTVTEAIEKCLNFDDACNDCLYEGCVFRYGSCTKDLLADALALLKEQEAEKKRVMKVIWDTLHEGLSIDTIPDQDWVYEQIRHRIEDT